MTYNFHSSCKHMHLSFKSVCNKEHKGVIYNMTSSSYSSQSTHPTGRVLGKSYSSFLDFTRNYKWTSGIFVPWDRYFKHPKHMFKLMDKKIQLLTQIRALGVKLFFYSLALQDYSNEWKKLLALITLSLTLKDWSYIYFYHIDKHS